MFAELVSQSYQKPLLGNVHLISTYTYSPSPFMAAMIFGWKDISLQIKEKEMKGPHVRQEYNEAENVRFSLSFFVWKIFSRCSRHRI